MILLLMTIAAIELEGTPRVGESTTMLVHSGPRARSGVTVQAVHHPGAPDETTVAVGATDAAGQVDWEPELAGIVEVRGGGYVERVVVGPPRSPEGALTVAATFTGVLLSLIGWAWIRQERVV